MTPKTPEDLRREIEAQQGEPSQPGTERTAEGEEVRTPSRREFFRNLAKTTRPRSAE